MADNASPLVIIIVLNWNGGMETVECLLSLNSTDYPNYQTMVVDNGSTDDSIKVIKHNFPAINCLETGENLGYAAGNNVGIRHALDQGADWVFILNNDTVVAPDTLSRMIDVGSKSSSIGVLGPMVYHYEDKLMIQSAGGILDDHWTPTHLGQNEYDNGHYIKARCVDWISGCAILVRREVLEKIGTIDERYYMYWEEVDFCLRSRKAGWDVVHVPFSKIWHKGVPINYQPSPYVTYYCTRNKLLIMSKHQASLAVHLYSLWQIMRTITSWTIKPKWRKMRKHRSAIGQGIVDYCRKYWGPMSK